mmetsp:Transcript_8462/g.16650  ORF Transcript_8462/g.16650 Transcript_8462/m.16650 type:complete len:80 (-) Transcript_8462:1309-1548(-)
MRVLEAAHTANIRNKSGDAGDSAPPIVPRKPKQRLWQAGKAREMVRLVEAFHESKGPDWVFGDLNATQIIDKLFLESRE